MNFSIIISLIIAIAIVGVFVLTLAMTRLYKRASNETAFVRTGMGGQKVVLSGGAIVLPIFQEYTPINMRPMKIVVDRREENALYTKDLLKADATIEFHVRVGRHDEYVSNAASLGLTEDPKALSNQIEGKLIGAIRSVAAQMDLSDLHQSRAKFNSEVREAVSADLERNGLELESVQLTNLNQTAQQFFDPNNSMDAEGLTKLTQLTQERLKTRNEIENNTKVQIKRTEVEAAKEALQIARDGEIAAIEQKKELDEQRAKTESLISITRFEEERKSQEAEIARNKAIEDATIAKDRDIELAKQDRAIKLHEKSQEEAAAKAKAEEARAKQVQATESVETTRLTEIAKREKEIAVIAAEKTAEEDSVGIRVKASAEKAAALDKAEAVKTETEAEVDRITKLAAANKATALAEAEGLLEKNKAENGLSHEAMALRQKLATIERLPAIISETVKPLANIDSIRIIDAGGIVGGNSSSVAEGTAPGGVDSIVNAALKYRTHQPLVDEILGGIGMGKNLAELAHSGGVLDTFKTAPRVPAAEPVGNQDNN
jgi:uncharacterized membrane protein YqiK